MKKGRISTALCAVMVVGSLADCGLKSPDTAATAAPAATETPATEAAKTEGDAAEEVKTEAAADTSNMSEVTLVVAEVNPLDTIIRQTDSKFKETVEEMSGDKIKIDLQASDAFGSENNVLDTMLGGGGTIDISCISAFVLIDYGAEESVLLSIPYTFANRDYFWKSTDSDLVPEFLMELHDNELGVRGLYYGEEGPRHFFTVKEVEGLDDLKGMKLRVSNDPIMNGTVEGPGVSPTVVSFNELYSTFQTSIMDGAGQPVANYSSNAFQEVVPSLILDGHILSTIQVIITGEVWDKLTEEQQNILVEAGKVVSQFNRAISEEVENKALEELKADGINVVEAPDIKPWWDACKDIVEPSIKGQAELYQQIPDMNKQ